MGEAKKIMLHTKVFIPSLTLAFERNAFQHKLQSNFPYPVHLSLSNRTCSPHNEDSKVL